MAPTLGLQTLANKKIWHLSHGKFLIRKTSVKAVQKFLSVCLLVTIFALLYIACCFGELMDRTPELDVMRP